MNILRRHHRRAGGGPFRKLSHSFQASIVAARRWLGFTDIPAQSPDVVPSVAGVIVISAFALMVAAGLLSVSRLAPTSVVGTSTPVVNPTHTYTSVALGYRLRYPADWRFEVSVPATPRGVQRERLIFRRGQGAVTLQVSRAPLTVVPLIPSAPRTLTVSGQPADRYRDYDPATGQSLDRVIVTLGPLHYEISGSGPDFEAFLANLSILSKH